MADLAKEKGGSVGCQRGAAEGVRSPRPILARGRRQVISKSQVYLVSLRRAGPQPEAQLGQVKAQKMFRFSCGLGQLLLAHGEQPVRILNPSSHNHTRARLQGEGRRAPSMAARFRGGRRGREMERARWCRDPGRLCPMRCTAGVTHCGQWHRKTEGLRRGEVTTETFRSMKDGAGTSLVVMASGLLGAELEAVVHMVSFRRNRKGV